jgi:hypothetical protein
MKELTEYRQKLIHRLDEAAMEFRAACLAIKQPYDPLEAGGWSVHQVAVHTRDVDKLVYGMRARRTLAEDNPVFPNFDGESYMIQHYDPEEPLGDVLDGLVAAVQSLIKQLSSMPAEGWSRLSSHETQGIGLTLQTWVERDLEHLEEHLATVKKVK